MQRLSKNFVTTELMELVMPVRTRTEWVCRTLKNMYSQCHDLFDLRNVPDNLMNRTTAQKALTYGKSSTMSWLQYHQHSSMLYVQ